MSLGGTFVYICRPGVPYGLSPQPLATPLSARRRHATINNTSTLPNPVTCSVLCLFRPLRWDRNYPAPTWLRSTSVTNRDTQYVTQDTPDTGRYCSDSRSGGPLREGPPRPKYSASRSILIQTCGLRSPLPIHRRFHLPTRLADY